MIEDLIKDLSVLGDPKKAIFLSRFFKTGKSQYAQGDIFLGITVPRQRQIASKYPNLNLQEIKELLHSKIHEYRLTALFILVTQFNNGNDLVKKQIYDFFLENSKFVNNWDLVDSSSDKIVGSFLLNNPNQRKILIKLAKSDNLWQRRIAMIATYQFIKNGEFGETLKIAEILLKDPHDLIQKAVGWMLREVGKRCSRETLEAFLIKHYKKMSRTTLRYAIEHFENLKRQDYLKGRI